MKRKMILQLILSSALFFTLFSHTGSFAVRPIETKINAPAQDFKLSNLTGQEISLAQLKGKPVILFFWTTWCPFCREEMSKLQNEYKNITAGGITLLAIDVGEPPEKAQRFFKGRNAEFPVLLDINSKVAYSYNLIGVPTFILIDAQGRIRFQGNSFPDNYLSILQENRLRR